MTSHHHGRQFSKKNVSSRKHTCIRSV